MRLSGSSVRARRIGFMPPTSCCLGSVRSAAVVNEEIRQLVASRGRRLTDEEKALLNELYLEWADAVRAEIVEAA